MTERTEGSCQRRGCAGGYEDVGGGELYCDLCGLAPVVSPGGLLSSLPTDLTGRASGYAPAGRDAAGALLTVPSPGPGSGSTPSSRRSASSRRSVSGRLSRSPS
ncbi:serine/threonine protein kinase, partial [Streptomyces lydicus]